MLARVLGCLVPLAVAAGDASGVVVDTRHRAENLAANPDDKSLGSLRWAAEAPKGRLTVINTNDGKDYFMVKGFSTTEGAVETVTLDFRATGAPVDITVGTIAMNPKTKIHFPDADWNYLTPSSPQWLNGEIVDELVGVWADPSHVVGPDSFAGVRVLAEFPLKSGILTMVGTDDGTNWFTLAGSVSGSKLTLYPLGEGTWTSGKSMGKSNGVIEWADGSHWVQGPTPKAMLDTATAPKVHSEAKANSSGYGLAILVVVGAVVAVAFKVRRSSPMV